MTEKPPDEGIDAPLSAEPTISERPLAKIIAKVPADRVTSFARNGRLPEIGECGEVEQMYTDRSGAVVCCVYLLDSNGDELWAADVFASEIAADPRNTSKA
jgi:hypothetical protein